MGPDYRVLVDKARKVSHTNYKRIYNEYPPTRILVQDVARVMQEATQSAGIRPYGVSLLIAGWDDGVEPQPVEAPATEGEEVEKKAPKGKTGGMYNLAFHWCFLGFLSLLDMSCKSIDSRTTPCRSKSTRECIH